MNWLEKLKYGSSRDLFGSTNLLVDQNVAGRLYSEKPPPGYLDGFSLLVDTISPSSRTWLATSSTFLECVGLSGQELPIPQITKAPKNLKYEEQVNYVIKTAACHFEKILLDKDDYIKEFLSSLESRLLAEKNVLALEMLEAQRSYFQSAEETSTRKLVVSLAYAFAQNLDLYTDTVQGCDSLLCTLMKMILEGKFIPLFRLLLTQPLLRKYQQLINDSNISASLLGEAPYLSKDLPGLKLKGEGLDCELIHYLIVGAKRRLPH